MGADFAIDLGTATTTVWARRREIVLREPTIVAVDIRRGRVIASGAAAYDTLAASDRPAQLHRPLDGGAVTDFAMTARMLKSLFDRLGINRFSRTRVLITVPAEATQVERGALRDAAQQAGAGKVFLMEDPMAAAIGAGLPVHDPVGSMVVDIGGGNTEVAVVSLGGVVVSKAVRVGGFDLDQAVQDWLRDHYDIAIGDRTAEELKIALGRGFPSVPAEEADVRGRDLISGLTRTVRIDSEQMRVAFERPATAIAGVVTQALSDCPPELAQDVMDQGILLVGGGALLHGLDKRIAAETQVDVRVAENALDAVIVGAGAAVDADWDLSAVFGG